MTGLAELTRRRGVYDCHQLATITGTTASGSNIATRLAPQLGHQRPGSGHNRAYRFTFADLVAAYLAREATPDLRDFLLGLSQSLASVLERRDGGEYFLAIGRDGHGFWASGLEDLAELHRLLDPTSAATTVVVDVARAAVAVTELLEHHQAGGS